MKVGEYVHCGGRERGISELNLFPITGFQGHGKALQIAALLGLGDSLLRDNLVELDIYCSSCCNKSSAQQSNCSKMDKTNW